MYVIIYSYCSIYKSDKGLLFIAIEVFISWQKFVIIYCDCRIYMLTTFLSAFIDIAVAVYSNRKVKTSHDPFGSFGSGFLPSPPISFRTGNLWCLKIKNSWQAMKKDTLQLFIAFAVFKSYG